MGRAGYIFSLDAFVSFSLILLSVQALLVMSSSPAGYYRQLLQASFFAHDTLDAMKIAKLPAITGIDRTYMDYLSDFALTRNGCQTSGPCSAQMRNLNDLSILPQYSYAYFYDNLNGSSWIVYNASNDSQSTHKGIPYRRIQASAQSYMLGFTIPMNRGYSPFCNVVCRGFNGTGNSTSEGCTSVPCGDPPSDYFRTGNFSVGMIRMVVWG
jgi:hypothetical protein